MTRWLAIALAALVVAATLRYGTFAAGGSDSYCYVEQAERWAAGTITAPVAPGETFPWKSVPLSLAPTGFIPSPVHDGAIAPICPAGLALAMAVPRIIGLPRASVFYVVPICAGLATWAVFAIGRRMAPGTPALLGAAVAVTTPVFVFQGLQPMSDVPAAALWALALASVGQSRWATFASGLATGAAVLVRPNLAPLAGILGMYVLLDRTRSEDGRAVGRDRLCDAIAFACGVVPGVIGVLWVNRLLYGAPLSSGYGSLEALFAWSHVVQNLSRYPAWTVSTASPLIAVAVVAPFVVRNRGYAWMLLAFALGVVALYLPYVPFDNWTYVRFLLPALLPAFALAMAAIASLAPRRGAAPVVVSALIACVWCGWHAYRVDALHVLAVTRDERRFIVTGRFAGDALPSDTLVFTIWQSGSVRYYGNRLTVLWDALEPAELDPAVDALAARSRDAVLVLDAFERDMFRRRFAGASRFADLDWPPLARVGSTVTVWRFSDRARYQHGARFDTQLVR